MTLKEIINALDKAYAAQENNDKWFELLPTVPYNKLPASLQKDARERNTPENMKAFLEIAYSAIDYDQDQDLQHSFFADLELSIPDYTKMIRKQHKKMLEAETQDPNICDKVHTAFELLTQEIPPETLNKILIRTRNTAVFTIQYEGGSLAPMLYDIHAMDAFEAALHEYQEHEKAKQLRKKEKAQGELHRDTTRAARRSANLGSAGYYQFAISDKLHQYALTTQKNNNAYIALMNPDFFERMDFKNGILTYDQETAGVIKQYKKDGYTDIQTLDFPLLTQIYTAAARSNIRNDAYTITVSTTKFFREMGIDITHGHASDIMQKLHSFENCVGIMPGTQTISKLFSLIQVDMKNQTMTFAVPYIFRLIEVLEEKNRIETKTRSGEIKTGLLPFHNTLIHSKIASEKNKAAVELVYLITTGLLQRGYDLDTKTNYKKNARTKHPNRTTYSISFQSLIRRTQLLGPRIESCKDQANQNKALRRAFTKAYQLLEEKTDAFQWFTNLHYEKIIPTMATLDKMLTFTHEGRNAEYTAKE